MLVVVVVVGFSARGILNFVSLNDDDTTTSMLAWPRSQWCRYQHVMVAVWPTIFAVRRWRLPVGGRGSTALGAADARAR